MPPSIPRDSNSPRPFEIRRLADISAQPNEQRWLIDPLWLQSGVGILGGPPKACKTYLAAELALAVATGKPALGQFEVYRPGPVLFYGAEDSLPALRARFDGLAGVRAVSIHNLSIYMLDAPLVRLNRLQDVSRLRAAIEQCQPRLLVLDPFIRIAQVDENSAGEVSAVLASLREIQREYDLAVLVVHHARKSPAALPVQAFRGSSDFAAWSDSNLFLSRNKHHLTLYLEHRSAPAPNPFRLRLEPEPAPHLLLLDQDQPATNISIGDPHPLQTEILDLLSAACRPLPTVEIRRLACKRKEDVVEALFALKSNRHITRTSRGWLLDLPD